MGFHYPSNLDHLFDFFSLAILSSISVHAPDNKPTNKLANIYKFVKCIEYFKYSLLNCLERKSYSCICLQKGGNIIEFLSDHDFK